MAKIGTLQLHMILCYSNTSFLTVHVCTVCIMCMNALETWCIVQNVGVGGEISANLAIVYEFAKIIPSIKSSMH